MFTASDLTDWFDDGEDKFWAQQDDWLIAQQDLGNAHPLVVFASWASDRAASAPMRGMHTLAAGVVDVLRLGSDLSKEGDGLDIAKGIFLNVTRVLQIIPAVGETLGVGARFSGMLAETKLIPLKVKDTCRFISTDRALTFARGKRVQLFTALDDIVEIRGPELRLPSKSIIEEILENPSIKAKIGDAGVLWHNLGNMKSLQEVFEKAKKLEGALTIGVQWTDRFRKVKAHRMAVVKDAFGNVRILEAIDGKVKGFASLRDLARAKPSLQGIENAALRPMVLHFTSKYLRFLQSAQDTWHLALPVAIGMQWGKSSNLDSVAAEIVKSASDWLKQKLGAKAPPLPTELQPKPNPSTNNAANGVPPEAAGAPRSDWLTGVQYRLKYLAYYNGPIHGVNDRATKDAVIQFQTDQVIMIDGIPGPQTQGELVRVCGF